MLKRLVFVTMNNVTLGIKVLADHVSFIALCTFKPLSLDNSLYTSNFTKDRRYIILYCHLIKLCNGDSAL